MPLLLRYERNSYRLSQDNVAAAARLHQPVYCLIENGRLLPTPEQLQRLAGFFGVHPPEKLLERVLVVRERR